MMYYYQNSCVVSFQNVLEYFLNVNKDSVEYRTFRTKDFCTSLLAQVLERSHNS